MRFLRILALHRRSGPPAQIAMGRGRELRAQSLPPRVLDLVHSFPLVDGVTREKQVPERIGR